MSQTEQQFTARGHRNNGGWMIEFCWIEYDFVLQPISSEEAVAELEELPAKQRANPRIFT